ncbi:MAG TPA: heterodisulfide reductase-related iron-sulfur binding cluster [Nocardioides sp.]|uniref:heterodisulfide reductase-related iron-sulfur binding cluster n=1 Tax=Nocardioides sp. TaxID=35761 RepID=UPI002E33F192|nr:heterodisulfide reductase-related iron-sulfur binding cluster [Nocardioides sp.]HEX5090779.1 heterodisulfide reductase-related iron-sulfur binding cluster [Nocardioides sp.]
MLILGLVMLVVALPVAGRRVLFLYRLVMSGQPAPDRVEHVTSKLGEAVKNQVVEVFGQKKLLKWTVPGAAHFFVFWAFVILGTVYLEAFGILFSRNEQWAIPVIGHWDLLGFAQDTIALLALAGIVVFAVIRLRNRPEQLGRRSRFSGSHLGGAWLILFMIFNVIWTMFLFRGAAAANGNLPYGNGAYASHAVGHLFDAMSPDSLDALEGVGLLLHIGVMLAFLVIVLNSKHLHIFVAPLNILFGRHPVALGAVKPLMSEGKPVTLDDIEDMDENTTLGIGSIEDFSWKGILDFATCTECGRCQSQCPAWNTDKPLSPKMLIMNLRDHAFAKAPYLLADEGARASLPQAVLDEADRPLVGETEGLAWEPEGGAVIDTDVLWSCVTCGACVNQCPVDIEHVDHIVDMRRYQVLVESSFPSELNQLFKGMENKGNPWNMSPTARMDWAQGLDFEVKVVGEDVESLDEVEWLFWVGCAGAYEDRQKKTTRAVAELLHLADVSFAVLGNGETCNGDQARRAGNEFVFQGLAQQNVETFKEYKVKKVVSTCAHCFNTLKNEYKDFGIELEVVHHTQLLNRLVREGRLTPVREGAGAHKRTITYHDPCYIGRHNGVYSPPRELLQVLPGADFVEMPRNSERSFCCGAGGARMWMEENIGTRINSARTSEAVATGADQIAVGCPFCRVMLSDGLTAAIDKGEAREEVEVLDVAQMLLASVKGEVATRQAPVAAGPGGGGTALKERPVETRAEPEPGDETITADTVTETSEASPAAKASGGGSSLFDVGDSAPAADEAPVAKASGGSLFDVEALEEAAPAEPVEPPAATSSSGSLFDIETPEPEAGTTTDTTPVEPVETPAAEAPTDPDTATESYSGSLFDIEAPEPEAGTTTDTTPVEPVETPAAEAPTQPDTPAESYSGSLFDIAAPEVVEPPAEQEPGPAPEGEATAPDDEPAPAEQPTEREPEDQSGEEKPKPTSSGETHTPKTDVDIDDSGSLFDL